MILMHVSDKQNSHFQKLLLEVCSKLMDHLIKNSLTAVHQQCPLGDLSIFNCALWKFHNNSADVTKIG